MNQIKNSLLLLTCLAACGRQLVEFQGGAGSSGGGAATIAPTVVSTQPANGATAIALNTAVTATFSEAMTPATVVSPAHTFTLQEFVTGNVIAGTVTLAGATATFLPTSGLSLNTKYTSSISTAAQSASGKAIVATYSWTWTTGDTADVVAPLVTDTLPRDGAVSVSLDQIISASFSEQMQQATMISTNFTVIETVSTNSVPGAVSYDVQNNVATFLPQGMLTPDTQYTVTVSNAASDLAGNALVVPALAGAPRANPWSFRTAAALAINLRTISTFGAAAHAGMTSTGVTVINGDVALTPTNTCIDSTGGPGGSAQSCTIKSYASTTGLTVTGSIYFAADPFDNGRTAQSVSDDLNSAWLEGQAKAPTQPTVAADQLGSLTPFFAGVYHNANLNLAIGSVATMDAQNDPSAIFIFQVDSDLTDSGTTLAPSRIDLVNGAQARNVWFVVGRDITIGSGTTWNGTILAGRDATVNHSSTVTGRVLAGAGGAGAIVLTGAATPSLTTITIPQ